MSKFLLRQWHRVPHQMRQFIRYLISGGSAAALEIITFQLMLLVGVWYQVGAPLSSVVGTVSAFLFHKYFAFQKHQDTGKQSVKYLMLVGFNFVAQYALVIAFVEWGGVAPLIAKVLSIGCSVCWNFFLYKFFVYA